MSTAARVERLQNMNQDLHREVRQHGSSKAQICPRWPFVGEVKHSRPPHHGNRHGCGRVAVGMPFSPLQSHSAAQSHARPADASTYSPYSCSVPPTLPR